MGSLMMTTFFKDHGRIKKVIPLKYLLSPFFYKVIFSQVSSVEYMQKRQWIPPLSLKLYTQYFLIIGIWFNTVDTSRAQINTTADTIGTDTTELKDNVLKLKNDNFSIKNTCIRYTPKVYPEIIKTNELSFSFLNLWIFKQCMNAYCFKHYINTKITIVFITWLLRLYS